MDTADKISAMQSRIQLWILNVIRLARKIPKDEVSRVFIGQLIRAATSVGANYEEASETETPKDLVYKLSLVKKEAKESKYWLGLIETVYPTLSSECNPLIQESDELVRIFATVIRNKSSRP